MNSLGAEQIKAKVEIPVISIVGFSDSGKTTLLEKILREGKKRGWRMATIKHDGHSFEIDRPGKDTWRHAQAGADVVVISSPQKVAILENVKTEKTLDDLIARMPEVDIVFTEGYKRENKPKIEVFRSTVHQELVSKPEELIAIASDITFELGVPCFGLEDAEGICDLIKRRFSLS